MEINGFHVLCILLEFIGKFWPNTVILLSFDIKLSEFIWKYVPLGGCLTIYVLFLILIMHTIICFWRLDLVLLEKVSIKWKFDFCYPIGYIKSQVFFNVEDIHVKCVIKWLIRYKNIISLSSERYLSWWTITFWVLLSVTWSSGGCRFFEFRNHTSDILIYLSKREMSTAFATDP